MTAQQKIVFLLLFIQAALFAQNKQTVITGKVTDNSAQPVEGVHINLSNTLYTTLSDKKGNFILSLPPKQTYRLILSHTSYQTMAKEIRASDKDTVTVLIKLLQRYNLLDSISVTAVQKPETLVGKPNYSIYDFDFYEDKLLLLAAEHSLSKASIQLGDYNGKIYSTFDLPRQAGEAKHFFHDYEGYTDIVCNDSIFRLDLFGQEIIAMPVKRADFNKYLLPVADTTNDHYFYNDQWDKYPAFNYYSLKAKDTVAHLLSTISNADLMRLYNLEYYYLPSRMQLEARQIANYYKTDKHIIAALMSGFTQSMYYEPLYAPLFVLRDTICIFNHHNDFLYHYDKNTKLIDSVKISYHHPKNWREWKKQMYVDELENKVYAFFSKDGHHYLKQIDHQTGREILTYKLKQHSAEKIKIRSGYVYYVYRPFGSTQERFLYRERIE